MQKSPDGKHKAELTYEGEMRFGPVYYSLAIDGATIRNRIFGEALKWSDDSRYLVTQEWLTTNYQHGPITRVALFDIEEKQVSEFRTVEQGFAENFHFEGNALVYEKHFPGKGLVREVEVNIEEITNWKPMGS